MATFDHELLELLTRRRSIRRFTPDPVPPETLETLLNAARQAPSAGNLQTWRVMVVTSAEQRAALSRRPDDFLPTAPLVLVFCADPAASADRYDQRGRELYALQEATLAAAHAMLMATALGLGSCWVGAFDEQRVTATLGLPRGLRPVVLLVVGFPAEQPEAPPRKTLEQLCL